MSEETARIAEEIENLSCRIGELANRLKTAKTTATTQKPQTTILTNFPDPLAELVTANIQNNCWIIRPRQFLGSDNFAKIASVVRELGGEYVSAGRDSHFRVPV